MATNFRVKIGKIGRLVFVHRLGIPKGIAVSTFGFQKFHMRLNLVNFGLWSSNSGV